MRIGVDAREIQNGVVTGIGRPLANFIRYFSQTQTGHTLVLFSDRTLPPGLACGAEEVTLPPCLTFIWDQWKLPRALVRNRIDLFYSPYYKVPLIGDVTTVGQVLDLMYLVFPLYRSALGPWRRLYYATFGRAFSLKAQSIITDSEHAKTDIIRLWRINPHKITVIPLGLSPRYQPMTDTGTLDAARSSFHLPEHFMLYLGNFKPHKNIEFLIRVFARIAPRFPEYKLVLAGPLDAHGLKMQAAARQAGIADKVIFTGIIREEDRPEALLSLADLFVFPSLYEGFGLPPLEAMACGTPVAVSRETSLPEVVGDAGTLFDPKNIDETVDIIARLLTDNPLRKRYAAAGLKRAEQFREEQTAGRVCSHLISMLPEKKNNKLKG